MNKLWELYFQGSLILYLLYMLQIFIASFNSSKLLNLALYKLIIALKIVKGTSKELLTLTLVLPKGNRPGKIQFAINGPIVMKFHMVM